MFFRPLLLPLLAQVALTFIVLARMYWLRLGEIQRKKIEPQSLASRRDASQRLTDSAAASDHFVNLFETPVLFYAAIFTALILMIPDRSLAILAWMYVGLRVIHAFIHTGANTVMSRFYVFLASCAVLLGMWLRLGWYIVTA